MIPLTLCESECDSVIHLSAAYLKAVFVETDLVCVCVYIGMQTAGLFNHEMGSVLK